MICMRQDFYVACKESCVIDFLPLAVYGTDPVRTIGEIVSVSLSLGKACASPVNPLLTIADGNPQTEWYNLFGASLNVPIWLVEYDCRDLAAATTCPPEAANAYARAGELLPDLLRLERSLDAIV